MPIRRHLFPLLFLALLCAVPRPAAAELGFYGWGPRLGVADDPDQVLVGIHQDFGEFADRVRFQISLDVGFGDDHTIATLTLPVHYRFRVDGDFVPYLGGGLVAGYVEVDRGRREDDSEFDIGAVVAGGIEKRLRSGNDILLELQLPISDHLHDAKLILGWMLRAR